MGSELVSWSAENQKRLQTRLCGMWAEDTWTFEPTSPIYTRCCLRFALTSPSLKVELKYAVWSKLVGRQKILSGYVRNLRVDLNRLLAWFNQLEPPVRSLMEKRLVQWEESLQAFLIQNGKLRQVKSKHLLATQQYVEYQLSDRSIDLLRQLYGIIAQAYDDRPETEKDVWDVRAMGLAPDLLYGANHLDFTPITQPWLRSLAKEYLRYRTGTRSLGTCKARLSHIVSFSGFLSRKYPTVDASGIDRKIIAGYLSDLNERGLSGYSRNSHICSLRDFFEICSSRLGREGLFREILIVSGDFPKKPESESREIPESVLVQLRAQLETLPTTELRMVVILLECGLRISELCTLPLDCLICDDRNDWYLRSYQGKSKREHIIPLVSMVVIGTIQAQQQEVRAQWGERSPYLFPRSGSPDLPYRKVNFANRINRWAFEKDIRDSEGKLYRFQSHQFRHTVGMRLINDDVPLEVISRLLGHRSLKPTRIYANQRAEKLREELERVHGKRRTVNDRGEVVKGAGRSNDQEAQLVSGQSRGQTLPAGNCGRPLAEGDCVHANSCLTCHLWLTSTEDLPRLKAFYGRALHMLQRAVEAGNEVVKHNQERIISNLAVRIAKLEDAGLDRSLSVEDLLDQLRSDLAGAVNAREESREAGRLVAVKAMELIIVDLKANITALEGTL
jgi:integrase/recombinase XerD